MKGDKKEKFPSLALGTWALGGGYWGPQNHSDSVKTIHSALREGIKLFDTAPVYGKGQSEMLLGQQLKKVRHDVMISTKCFHKPVEQLKKSFYLSLKRLLTDYIDIYYIHWPETGVDMRPAMDLLESWRKEGRIRYIGVSNFNKEQIMQVREAGVVDIVQNGYNFLWQEEEELFIWCAERGIGIQPYSILAQGLLTGKFTEDNILDLKDMRHKLILFRNLPAVFDAVEKLRLLAEEEGCTVTQLIILWTKSRPFVSSVLVGCRTRKQVEEFAAVKNKTLSPHALKVMNEISLLLKGAFGTGPNLFNHLS